MAYNATVTAFRDGEVYYTFVAEVAEIGGRLQMLRGNGVSCTGYEGKVATLKPGELATKYPGEVALYDLYLRETHPKDEFVIAVDDCAGYRNKIAGLDLPPAYKGDAE